MVDERDRLRKLRRLEAETTAAAPVAPVAPVGAGGSLGLEDRIRQLTATTSRSATPAPKPTSSVPTTPVNQNIPIAPAQSPMKEIVTNTGERVMVYTSGPLAGQDKDGNFPVQATDPASFAPKSDEGDGGDDGGDDGGAGADVGVGTGLTAAQIQALVTSYTAERLDRMSQEQKTEERLSAYNILKMEFDQYGLGSLVTDIRDLLINDTPTSEFGLRLRGTDAYKARFKANEARIAAGLSVLSPAEYVALEDQYQNVMRNYGLPASYYTKDPTGKQVGFEKFIAGDVSATELADRISTAQKRVINANPEVSSALRAFYPDIQNGDILAYVLDPSQGLENIKRKVTAAEIGGAAMSQGLGTSATRAMQLAGYGVDKEAATAGFATIGAGLQRGSQLASIYGKDPYTQTTAEQEVFNIAGAQEARKQRQKVTGLEKATFGGQSGVTSGALARDRAGGY
jgi:hypothetical protein